VSVKAWNEVVLSPLDREPAGTSPQRGFIEPQHAALLRSVLHTAAAIGSKVLGIDDPLEADIERTPERVQRVESTLLSLAKSSTRTSDVPHPMFQDLVMAELFGYGPLDRFLREGDVSEIMVNGPYVVFIERGGKMVETGHKFLDDQHVERIIRRIVRPLGRSVGPDNPLVDARLPDGSRVNAAVSPCTLDGPSLTIRKFQSKSMALSDLVTKDALSPAMARFLAAIVRGRQNIVVSGGTGSGKTTLINAASQFIPDTERTVTIEDAAELRLVQRNVVRLESKKASRDSPVGVSIRDCLVNALRMRPERIIIGECRSAEAIDMLQAMNTGHDGSMTTVHANNPRAAISRVETLALLGGLDMPLLVIRKQIASAIHFIVQVSRLRDGRRKVTNITEILGMEGETVTLADIFVYQEEGIRDGVVVGRHRATGNRPRCIEELVRHGADLPPSLFFAG
jgi:pilus assembly protein CpaF